MNKPKSKVVKSKSSNNALTKSKEKNKKSRSNARLPTLVTKKRGVYVERKPTREPSNNSGNAASQKETRKIPRRPSRGQKRFLSSVLTLLSQSSTGTQHPAADRINNTVADSTIQNTHISEITTMVDKETKKKKYRSKILNSECNRSDKFEVLQSKKEMIHTPSVTFSEDENFENIKWSDFLPRLVKPDEDEIQLEKNKKLSHLVREVTEGRMVKEKTIKIGVKEPSSLMLDHKKDSGLYNFFVDLLETTFSVYNVNPEYNVAPVLTSTQSSKVDFEIDESVANKLNINTEDLKYVPSLSGSTKNFSYKNEKHNWNDTNEKILDYFQSKPSRKYKPSKQDQPIKYSAKKKRINSDFGMTNFSNTQPYSQSTGITQRKSFYRQSKKQNLLNLLKEKLKMSNFPFEEPQNLYQALKVMAKTKRKSEKTIRFDKTARIGNEFSHECTLKRRKVIYPPPKGAREKLASAREARGKYIEGDYKIPNKRSMSPQNSPFQHGRQRYAKSDSTDDEMSNHSLEVYNFDYDSPMKRAVRKRKGQVTALSSPSESEREFKNYDSVLRQVLLTVEAICHPKPKFH